MNSSYTKIGRAIRQNPMVPAAHATQSIALDQGIVKHEFAIEFTIVFYILVVVSTQEARFFQIINIIPIMLSWAKLWIMWITL